MSPLPSTKVVPAGWSAHHRPTVEATLTGHCTIAHPGTAAESGTFDQSAGEYTGGGSTPTTPHHEGPCTVGDVPSTYRETTAADEDVPTMMYLVEVPVGQASATKSGDLLVVDDVGPHGDPALQGRPLYVEAFARGTYVWTRGLICTETQNQT